jgi:exopolyphosphatase/guanosine-5'-triphosphate,3'-diphosphate pyrophosphatase
MKVAVIDLGTNTFHLIIAEITASAVNIIYKTNLPVKLGEGRINDNVIIQPAFERGLLALEEFENQIKAHDVTLVKATATSAIRSAENGLNFVKAAKSYTGICIDVITGDQEASYIYEGVKATAAIKGISLIMDIGGGSTEFIICNEDRLIWKKSYNIGAARLTQAYFTSDPISAAEQLAIQAHLEDVLTDLIIACRLHRPKQLIGSAGAFETFAGMLDDNLDLKTVKSAAINLQAYRQLAHQLIHATHAERAVMPNLIALRVDMIVIAALITNYIIDNTEIETISLSTYDLKMGVLHELTRL